VIDDREGEADRKWMLAGKVLHHNVFHVQTIAGALRPAWGNPKGLFGVSGFVCFEGCFEGCFG
jgi:hypothetical protein